MSRKSPRAKSATHQRPSAAPLKQPKSPPSSKATRFSAGKKPAGPATKTGGTSRIQRLATPTGVTQKLHKVLAQRGLGSRRDMEEWIRTGQVTVNGVVAGIGARVSLADRIQVGRRLLRIEEAPLLPRVLLYHKPEGEITSREDPQGRPSVFDKLPPTRGSKWIAIGRLDFNTCGLLIFTTSGDLANRMMHPRFELEREYAVRVLGRLQPQHLQQLTEGIELEDGMARCEHIELRGGEGANQWCHVVLREGRNRIVRRLFEKLGFAVSRLMRVRFGAVALPARLKRGQFAELSAGETQTLLDWLAATAPDPLTAASPGAEE